MIYSSVQCNLIFYEVFGIYPCNHRAYKKSGRNFFCKVFRQNNNLPCLEIYLENKIVKH